MRAARARRRQALSATPFIATTRGARCPCCRTYATTRHHAASRTPAAIRNMREGCAANPNPLGDSRYSSPPSGHADACAAH